MAFGAGQSKGHVATAPVVAHPMFQSQVTPTPFGLVDNEIQLKLDPDRLNSFSDLKQDDIVAILGSQSMANQGENHAHASAHAAGHIGPSALSDNFLQQQGGATGDGSIKQEHSSGTWFSYFSKITRRINWPRQKVQLLWQSARRRERQRRERI